MTEKELEKLFRSKLDSREFEFNPANWAAMEAMLNQRRKPAGAYYWRGVAAILLFGLLMSGALLFQDLPGSEVQNPITHQQNTLESGNELESIERSKSANPIQTLEQKSQPDQNSANSNASQSNKVTSEPNSIIASTPDATIADADEVAPKKSSDQDQLNVVEAAYVEDDYFTERETELALRSIAYSAPLTSPKGSLMAFETFTPEALEKFHKSNTYYLELAPVFTGSYNTNDVGIGWSAGVGMEKEISDRWTMTAGLRYSVQNGIGIENKTDSTFYNFGKETIETEVKSRRLDYVEMPLTVGYNLNGKHQLIAGGYLAYLVNVSQDVSREISQYKRETEIQTESLKGYQKDFNRLDGGIQVGYRYRLGPGLSVGLHYNYGLTDITKNTKGEYVRDHHNQNTRVVFRYSIL